MVAATFSNAPMEDVAKALGDGTGFFQLYTPNDDALAESLVRARKLRASRRLSSRLTPGPSAGVRATSTRSTSPNCAGAALANYFSDPNFRKRLAKTPEEDRAGGDFGMGQASSAGRSPGRTCPGFAR